MRDGITSDLLSQHSLLPSQEGYHFMGGLKQVFFIITFAIQLERRSILAFQHVGDGSCDYGVIPRLLYALYVYYIRLCPLLLKVNFILVIGLFK